MANLKIYEQYWNLKGNWLFLDPGLGGTGFAIFNGIGDEVVPPARWGVLRVQQVNAQNPLPEKLHDLTIALNKVLLDASQVNEVLIEFPEMWGGSATSLTAGLKGDLIKLATVVGGLTTAAHWRGVRVHYITPAQWKGQLTKEHVTDRVVRAWGQEMRKVPNHAMDAVGMGLALQGGL